MWPFRRKPMPFKDYFNQQVLIAKKEHRDTGLIPNGNDWDLLDGMATYLLNIPIGPEAKTKIDLAYRIYHEAEAEMDFARAAVSVSAMAYFSNPQKDWETNPQYAQRIFSEYVRYTNKVTHGAQEA